MIKFLVTTFASCKQTIRSYSQDAKVVKENFLSCVTVGEKYFISHLRFKTLFSFFDYVIYEWPLTTDDGCHRKQCSKCMEYYIGSPEKSHQCYRLIIFRIFFFFFKSKKKLTDF